MGLQTGDLKDTILKKISIDEYEPKTGDSSEVLVLGFSLKESAQGQDLYNFLNSSIFEIRDVEVSPNPNPENYYMVFVEMDRNENVLENIRKIITDVENISGKLPWVGKTHLTDEFHPIFDEGISRFVITDPEKYMTKAEFEQQQAEEQAVVDAKVESDNSIMEFLKTSNLLKASINNNTLEVEDKFNEAKLEIVGFGEAKDIMAEIGINESAIGDMDSTLKQFNSMLGEMNAIPIQDYIVIFHPQESNVLVTKQI
tara:strand:- start:3246 stop:4013 length:768 start_codon:yes stop_codon:yes gene_type:complete